MRTIELTGGRRLTQRDLRRKGALPQHVTDAAVAIVDDVAERGDVAVREYCERFDGVAPQTFLVPAEVVQSSLDVVDPAFLDALRRAARQIRDFHEREVEQSWLTTRPDGTILGVKVTPVPSDGTISAYTLAAAALAGVDEVYAVGGAQAIGAAAYGTETIPKVSKIVGPGNAYVAAAKRYVSGDVGIDMVAGPSEVCVLADASSDPAVVAADLMAQAEHDPMAACYLVTCDAQLAESVVACIEKLVSQSPREEITRASLDDHGVIVVSETMESAIDAVNVIAPEHLELHVEAAFDLLGKIENAGAIFVGPWSSEPLGDYVAGPNHTLPTGGTATFSNPLGVYDFVKRSSVISYTREGLAADGPAVQTLAQAEGLFSHALSVGMRRRLVEEGTDAYADPVAACEDIYRVAWPEDLAEPPKIKLFDVK